MTRTLTISLDQLYRDQPGGIGTYVRGLVRALRELDADVVGLTPGGAVPADVAGLGVERSSAHAGVALVTRLWPHWPLGVPSRSAVVHATSMAGPFSGGRDALHSVALHDLLWRDEPASSTPAGIRFHERRLEMIVARDDLLVLTTSPGLDARLIDVGIDASRIRAVRLGADDDAVAPASTESVRALLDANGVSGPFTLYAGTLEPRKNLERLVRAHAAARARETALGPLVVVGPGGWGSVELGGAHVLGLVSRAHLLGLYRDASVVAYVPRAEGFGLPPVEALHAGARVVASSTTPSVRENPEVVIVDPLDEEDIADGLERAVALDDDAVARARRSASVDGYTWRHCALDHLEAWR